MNPGGGGAWRWREKEHLDGGLCLDQPGMACGVNAGERW